MTDQPITLSPDVLALLREVSDLKKPEIAFYSELLELFDSGLIRIKSILNFEIAEGVTITDAGRAYLDQHSESEATNGPTP